MGNKYTKGKINARKTTVLQNFAKLAQGEIEVHKMSGMEGGENWSKIIICTLS